MPTVYLGGDASKGYADFICVDASGKVFYQSKLDDTFDGHEDLQKFLGTLGDCNVVVGLESSGGVERNWLRSLRELANPGLRVVQVNPLAVKRFRDLRLHDAVTDPSSARAIANYLRHLGEELPHQTDPEVDEAKRMDRFIAGQVEHCGELKTELQGLLVNSHPELVCYTREGVPNWILHLLLLYPTSSMLAKATVAELITVPYLTEERAVKIITAATKSVASALGVTTSELVSELAAEILRMGTRINTLRERLYNRYKSSSVTQIYASLLGFGPAISLYLTLALGDCRHLHSDGAAVAFCGLDPRIHNSGDERKNLKISKKGDSRTRALLFNAAMTAIRYEGPFRDFYQRLLKNGKPKMVALVAVMAKMVRVAYACQMKQCNYDSKFHAKKPVVALAPKEAVESTSLEAPISRREGLRRKKAAEATKRGQASKNVAANCH